MIKDKKDRFYFQHDYNARNDDDIEAMLLDYAASGYGLYWGIVERLHEEGNSIELNDRFYKAIGKQFMMPAHVIEKFVKDCCEQYKLFQLEGSILTCGRVKRNLEHRHKISEERSEAGKRGAIAKKNKAIASEIEANSSKGIANTSIGKERKGKENINVACAVCAIFGKHYLHPEERLPQTAGWFRTIDEQVKILLKVWKPEEAVNQIKAYLKHCENTQRKRIATNYKVAETLLSVNWIGINNPEQVPKANPFEDAEFNRTQWTDEAWRNTYANQIKTNEAFKKHFQL